MVKFTTTHEDENEGGYTLAELHAALGVMLDQGADTNSVVRIRTKAGMKGPAVKAIRVTTGDHRRDPDL